MSNPGTQIDPLDAASAASEPMLDAEARAQADPRAKRDRRIKLSIASAILVRPINFLIPIITIPLFLRYLGPARYGLYESVGALAMWLGMTNLGLGLGLINRLTECDVKNDRTTARRCTSTLTLTMLAMMLVSLTLLTIVVPLVPWASVLNILDPVARSEVTLAVWVAGALTLLGLVSGLAPAIYVGYQETHRNIAWDGVARVAMLAAAFGVVLSPGFGTVGVLVAAVGVPAFVRLINTVYLFAFEKPWLRPSLGTFDLQALRWMASQGILLFLMQMSVLLLFQTDKLIIAFGRGVEEVVGYAILGRVFLIGYGVYMMLLTPLWPASGDAVRRGDLAWVARSVRNSTLLGLTLMIGLGLTLLLLQGPMSHVLQRLAGGEEIRVSVSLILAMTAMFATRSWVDAHSTVLNAAGVIKPQLPFYLGHAVLNAAVSIAVVGPFGVEGVAWSTPITGIITSVWAYPYLLRRYVLKGAKPT